MTSTKPKRYPQSLLRTAIKNSCLCDQIKVKMTVELDRNFVMNEIRSAAGMVDALPEAYLVTRKPAISGLVDAARRLISRSTVEPVKATAAAPNDTAAAASVASVEEEDMELSDSEEEGDVDSSSSDASSVDMSGGSSSDNMEHSGKTMDDYLLFACLRKIEALKLRSAGTTVRKKMMFSPEFRRFLRRAKEVRKLKGKIFRQN